VTRFRAVLAAIAVGALVAAAAPSCSEETDGGEVDRREMLREIGENVVVPTYRDFEARAGELADAAVAFCDAPSADRLGAAQRAWWEAHGVLRRGSAFAFGPHSDAPLRVGPKVDFWPVREDDVEEVLAGTGAIDPEALGASRKGLPVVEYLLYDAEGGDTAVMTAFDDPDGGARRCDYLTVLTADVVEQARTLADAWDPAHGDYLSELVDAGRDSESFDSLHAAVSEVVNRMLFAVENVIVLKLGKPDGDPTGGEPMPDLVESRYSDRSLEDMLDDLGSVHAVYTGSYGDVDGMGVDEYLRARSPRLDAAVLDHIELATRSISEIPEPLRTAVVEDRAAVQRAKSNARALHFLLGVDVANAMAVTVTFNDTDGD